MPIYLSIYVYILGCAVCKFILFHFARWRYLLVLVETHGKCWKMMGFGGYKDEYMVILFIYLDVCMFCCDVMSGFVYMRYNSCDVNVNVLELSC